MFIVTVCKNRKVKHSYLSHHLQIDNVMVMHFKVENLKLHDIFNITQEISNDRDKKRNYRKHTGGVYTKDETKCLYYMD